MTIRAILSSKLLCAAVVTTALLLVAGCSKGTVGTQHELQFDGKRSYEILKEQCSFGPRYPGTAGHVRLVSFIELQLKGKADEVIVHPFSAKAGEKTLDMKNIYAVFNPNASRFVLLAAHFDTRPIADQEVDPAKRTQPIPGANDGASGVAVLLELARIFGEEKPSVGVVMAFFDGEDYGPGSKDMFFGSREFEKTRKTIPTASGNEIDYAYGILLDMVGDKNLELPKEINSCRLAPEIVEKVWSTAEKLGYGHVFQDKYGYQVEDDHLPINRSGIKCIDVIDFNYGWWHTLEDTPDKCSADSLSIVGRVIERVIYDEPAILAK